MCDVTLRLYCMALVKSLSVLPTLEDDLSRLEQILIDSVIAENDYLTEIASHLITAGGTVSYTHLTLPTICSV